MTIRVIIADDEPLARSRLQRLLLLQANVEVVGVAKDGQQAVELVLKHRPEVVLLDIQMPLKTGIVAAQEIAEMQGEPPAIIFCTAFDQYALQAFDAQAVDYLLKPVMAEELHRAIHRASALSRLQLSQLATEVVSPAEISIQHKDFIEKRLLQDFIYFRAEEKHILAGTNDGQEIILDYTLKTLSEAFSEECIRTHRNTLINKSYLLRLERNQQGVVSVILKHCDQSFLVSRRHLAAVKRCFEGWR